MLEFESHGVQSNFGVYLQVTKTGINCREGLQIVVARVGAIPCEPTREQKSSRDKNVHMKARTVLGGREKRLLSHLASGRRQ